MAQRPPYRLSAKRTLWDFPHSKTWQKKTDARITSIAHTGDQIIASTMSGDIFFFTAMLTCDAPLQIGEPVCAVSVTYGILKVCTRDSVKDFTKQSRALLKEHKFPPGDAVAFYTRNKIDTVFGKTGAILRSDWRASGAPVDLLYMPDEEVPTSRAAVSPQFTVTTGATGAAVVLLTDVLRKGAHRPIPIPDDVRVPPGSTFAVAWHEETSKFFVDGPTALYVMGGDGWEGGTTHKGNTTPKTRLVAKGSFLIRASGRTLEIYNAHTHDLIAEVDSKLEGDISALSLNDNHLAVGTEKGELHLYTLRKLGGAL